MPNTTRFLLVVALVFASAPAHSQQPPPSLPKAGRPPQQHAKPEHRDTQPPQRGSDAAPVVVRISPAQIEQLIAAQKAEQLSRNRRPIGG
jgi:hypothetical protein